MIQSLRKEKGGYALLYVMVVVMVLCAISMMICTVALRSLQSQEASVRRMQDLYAAEGEIERIKASIGNNLSIDLNTNGNKEVAKASFVNAMCTSGAAYDSFCSKVGEHPTQLRITANGTTTTVTAILNVDDVVISSEEVETEETDSSTGKKKKETHYTLKAVSTSFVSYTIENTGGGS